MIVRDLQEWLRAVRTCTICGEEKAIRRFPRAEAISSNCYDCLDTKEKISQSTREERNRQRSIRSARFEQRLIEHLRSVNKKDDQVD